MSQQTDALASAEQRVVASAVEIATLKARMRSIERAGRIYSPDFAKLRRLEAHEKHIIDQRNALSRELADKLINKDIPWTKSRSRSRNSSTTSKDR